MGPLQDNCLDHFNPFQEDMDDDGQGDPCDLDADGDFVPNDVDVCPMVFDPDQPDCDGDHLGDLCEVDGDRDEDGIFDTCDLCPFDADPEELDPDNDGTPDVCDNCPGLPNEDQSDADDDGIGDVCDDDSDNDGVPNDQDNCPMVPNADQADTDLGFFTDFRRDDGGFATSEDAAWHHRIEDAQWVNYSVTSSSVWSQALSVPDAQGASVAVGLGLWAVETGSLRVWSLPEHGDSIPVSPQLAPAVPGADYAYDISHLAGELRSFGVVVSQHDEGAVALSRFSLSVDGSRGGVADGGDACDNCPLRSNEDQSDQDDDGVGDLCDDSDEDGVVDAFDLCPADGADPDQTDRDFDGLAAPCDDDDDEPEQTDRDGDGDGTPCDDDDDGDTVEDAEDNCPDERNPLQEDSDEDGIGDACDVCPEVADPDQADSDGGYFSHFGIDDGGLRTDAEEGEAWSWDRDVGRTSPGSWRARFMDYRPAHAGAAMGLANLYLPPVTMPEGATVELSWYHRMSGMDCPADTGLRAEVWTAEAGAWVRLDTDPAGANGWGHCGDTDWVQITSDLSAFAGSAERVRVRLRARRATPKLGAEHIWVDDLRISINGIDPIDGAGGDACDDGGGELE